MLIWETILQVYPWPANERRSPNKQQDPWLFIFPVFYLTIGESRIGSELWMRQTEGHAGHGSPSVDQQSLTTAVTNDQRTLKLLRLWELGVSGRMEQQSFKELSGFVFNLLRSGKKACVQIRHRINLVDYLRNQRDPILHVNLTWQLCMTSYPFPTFRSFLEPSLTGHVE